MIDHRWSPRRWAAGAVVLALLSTLLGPLEAQEPSEPSYLDALVQLAAGDREEALDQLTRFEIAAAPNGERDEIEALARTESRLARRLASEGGESLLPVARLHERAYQVHLAARRIPLAIHSRELTLRLVDLYRDGSGRPDTDRIAALLLTSLGGHLQEASMGSLAIGLYERAAELDPDEPTPLLALANVYERQGDYERAAPHLERALRIAPDHREAALRRALVLLRLGDTATAEASLEHLVASEEEDWILSVAYQELARSLSEAGDLERARDLLLEARRRLPDDPSLPLQIAYLVDRTGAGGSVEDLATALRNSAASSEPSPRLLYARITTESLESLRRVLEEHSRQHLVYLELGLRRLVEPSAAR